MEELAQRLAEIPGVVAVTLGGSRARGEERLDSDWDFGLYYRDAIDVDAVRALGYPGTVVEPGVWGRLVNGGARLDVDGVAVDLLYRDLAVVEHWLAEAEAGRFEVDDVEGCVAGMPTYVLAAELALHKPLAGELPRPEFPGALRTAAPVRWLESAEFSLKSAASAGRRSDSAVSVGLLVRATVAVAHARVAARGEWTVNEKGLVRRAGLGPVESIVAAVGSSPRDLERAVFAARVALGLPATRPGAATA